MAKQKPQLLYVYGEEGRLLDLEAGYSEELRITLKYMSQDEFIEQITSLKIDVPVIFIRDKGKLVPLVNNRKMQKIESSEELLQVIKSKLTQHLRVVYVD